MEDLASRLAHRVQLTQHAMAVHYMYYNFCRRHQTLTKARGGLHTSPAMAAGVADHVWTLEEVVGLLEASERSLP